MSKDIEKVMSEIKITTYRLHYMNEKEERALKEGLAVNIGRYMGENLDKLPMTYTNKQEGTRTVRLRVNIVSDRLYNYIKENEEYIGYCLEERERSI